MTGRRSRGRYSIRIKTRPTQNPWYSDICQAAEAYAHAYEITLEAEPVDSVPMTLSWSITPFTGATEVDVTPNQLKLRVDDGWGNKAEAGPYSGWSGSEVWDGGWSGGGSWDGCSQVEIHLEMMPPPLQQPSGIISVVATEPECGSYTTISTAVGKSITVTPCDDTSAPSSWISISPGGIQCPASQSTPGLLWEKVDKCGNTVQIWCEPSSPGGAAQFKLKYNGTPIGWCIYTCGQNAWYYRMTNDECRFHSLRQSTADRPTVPGCDEGTQGLYDWTVWLYNCLTGENIHYCREGPNLGNEFQGRPSSCECQ